MRHGDHGQLGPVTTASGSGVLGASGSVSDSVTVSGNTTGGSPTGNVTFYTCGPNAASPSSCSASSSDLLGSQTVRLTKGTSPDSSASTTPFTPTTTGTWCFGASYVGDSNYSGSTDNTTGGGVAAECVTVTQANSGSVTTASGSGVLGASGNISDSVTVSGNTTGGSPTGNVTFYTCGPNAASPSSCSASSSDLLGSQIVSLTKGTSPDSSASTTSFTPNTTGTWCFGASYVGDSNYSGSTDNTTGGGVAAECVTVTQANSGSVTTASGSGVLGSSGNISDSVTVSGNTTGGSPTGNVTFYTCGPNAASPSSCSASSVKPLGQPDRQPHEGHQPRLERLDDLVLAERPRAPGASAPLMSATPNYMGSTDNTTGNGVAAECVTVTTANSGSVTTASGSGVLGSSGSVSDSVTVSGNTTGGSPTGNVTFYTCGPNAVSPSSCSASSSDLLGSQTVSLTKGTSPDSSASTTPFTPKTTGTWCFGAIMSATRTTRGPLTTRPATASPPSASR